MLRQTSYNVDNVRLIFLRNSNFVFFFLSVASTAREPLAGWIDNYFGTMGSLVPFSKGLMRFITCNPVCSINIVPVDITINALIASAWDVFNQPHRYDPARWTLCFC